MRKISPLKILILFLGIFPLAKLFFDFFTNNFSPNPIQDLEQQTGFAAITLLVLSLAVTPLRILFKWRDLAKYRRTLGLYAFFYATLHISVYFAIDYAFNWSLLFEATLEKRYTLIGTTAYLLLIPLAITSYKWGIKKIGKNWRTLHKLVYLIAPMLILHFAWARKGDIFSLQGNILQPFIYGLFVFLLLVFRIPFIQKNLPSLRK
ncbi:MAG TPA: sulfoxide reductase heme-binding subunit YedZ [Anaerolineales bacterium]|nr:sulfoxide reductase heme-binding subunit YedZ [Anaerolineales bacterium]